MSEERRNPVSRLSHATGNSICSHNLTTAIPDQMSSPITLILRPPTSLLFKQTIPPCTLYLRNFICQFFLKTISCSLENTAVCMHASTVKSAWYLHVRRFCFGGGGEHIHLFHSYSIPSLIPQYGHVNAESMVQLNRKPPLESEVWPWFPPTLLTLPPPLSSSSSPDGPCELKGRNIVLLGIFKATYTAGHAVSAKQQVLNCTGFLSPGKSPGQK